MGWDNIPSNIIKVNPNILASILSNLINKTLAQQVFPNSSKRAKILPIYKNKDKLDIGNNSQILFYLSLVKLLNEFSTEGSINYYFSDKNIHSSTQFGLKISSRY